MKLYFLMLLVLLNGCATLKKSPQQDYVAKSFAKAREIKYKTDEPVEYWQLPSETAKLKTGDCEDKAFYLDYLLFKGGFDGRVVVGITITDNPIKDFNKAETIHAWNEVNINGVLYVLDSTSSTFKRKDSLGGWYQWDITQSKEILRAYQHEIDTIARKSNNLGEKKFAQRILKGFKASE